MYYTGTVYPISIFARFYLMIYDMIARNNLERDSDSVSDLGAPGPHGAGRSRAAHARWIRPPTRRSCSYTTKKTNAHGPSLIHVARNPWKSPATPRSAAMDCRQLSIVRPDPAISIVFARSTCAAPK